MLKFLDFFNKWVVLLIIIVITAFFFSNVNNRHFGLEREIAVNDTTVLKDAETKPFFTQPYEDILSYFSMSFKPDTSASIDILLNRLQDDNLSLKERRRAALSLAMSSSGDAISELSLIFDSLPPYVKAAVAEGLGENEHPDARALLTSLLQDRVENTIAMRGVIRGASASADESLMKMVADLISNPDIDDSIRAEAARELGAFDNSNAHPMIVAAIEDNDNFELESSLLDGLGNLPFTETSDFFQEYVNDNDNPKELRVAAIEALGNSADDPSPLLLELISNQEPDIRAAAAWALGDNDNVGSHGEILLQALEHETDNNVRNYLYQALGNQTKINDLKLIHIVNQEDQIDTRLAGYDLIASKVNPVSNNELTTYYNSSAVPELEAIALNGTDSQQLNSVIALSRAKTPESMTTLERIASQSNNVKTIAAVDNALGNID